MKSHQERHDPYAAFRIRSYRTYTVGYLAALVGTRIQTMAIGWEMYQRTGDPLTLGLVGLVQAIPMFLLALPAGHLADVFSRRKVLMLSMVGTTATSLSLAVLSQTQGHIVFVYVLLLLDSAALSVGRPARTAMLPQLVPARVFPNAVTWNASLFQFASVAGPAIGGLVVAWNVSSAYLISAASSVLFLALLVPIQVRPMTKLRDETEGVVLSLLGGVRFVKQTPLLLTIISLDMFAVMLGGAMYLLPVYAKDILHIGATGLGWLNAAPAAGAFCVALLMAHLPPMQRAGRNLLLAIAGFGAATIVFGLSQRLWLSLAMLFVIGAFDNVSVVIRHTLVQIHTPDHMRGRVSAVNNVFVGSSNELGGLESGLVAHWFGPIVSVVSGGIGSIVVVIITALTSSKLRALSQLTRDE